MAFEELSLNPDVQQFRQLSQTRTAIIESRLEDVNQTWSSWDRPARCDALVLLAAYREKRLFSELLRMDKYEIHVLNDALMAVMGFMPIHACFVGRYTTTPAAQKAILEALLDAGADIEHLDPKTGKRVLHIAAQSSGGADIVRFLLKRGADVDAKDKNGHTALFTAVFTNHTDNVLALLHYGASTAVCTDLGNSNIFQINHVSSARTPGSTLLHIAASHGASPTTYHLLAAHILKTTVLPSLLPTNPDDNETPLHSAARACNLSLLTYLLSPAVHATPASSLAAVNTRTAAGFTPLLLVLSRRGRAKGATLAALRLLVSHGADVRATTRLGWSALHLCAEMQDDGEDVEAAAFLISQGAQMDARARAPGPGTLEEQLEGFGQDVAMVRRQHAVIQEYDSSKELRAQTPLHWVAENFAEGLVGLLLEGGVDVDARDVFGATAAVRVVRSRGRRRGDRRMRLARQKSILGVLVDNGADVDMEDKGGMSVRKWAGKYACDLADL